MRPQKNKSTKELRDAKRIVRRIIAHYFDLDHSRKADAEKPAQITHLAGGLTNLVFSVRDARGNFVVRLGSDPGRVSAFMKEQWAIAKAREAGVPSPEVLQVGNEAAPVAYMISRQAIGTEARFHPERTRILRELGRHAAVINSIRTSGFGSTFDWSHNQLSHNATWSEFLQGELKIEEGLETLGSCTMLQPARVKKLRATLEGAAGKDRVPTLNHGDLRLKNVLVDDKGAISCILDWEHCTSNLAPEWELSIALHDLAIDEKQEFLDGYGLSREQIATISPVLKAMNLINYAPMVHCAAKNKALLEHYRVRLAGELDLYSL